MDIIAIYLRLPEILLFSYKKSRRAATTRQLPRRWKTTMASESEKAGNPDPHGTRAGFSLAVSKVSEDIISVIKQAAPTLRPSESGVAGESSLAANEAMNRFFRLGVAVSSYSDGQLMRMVAATLGKRDVVLAISTTGKPREIVDAASVAREYGTTVIAITKPNSPLAMVADIPLGLYVPET